MLHHWLYSLGGAGATLRQLYEVQETAATGGCKAGRGCGEDGHLCFREEPGSQGVLEKTEKHMEGLVAGMGGREGERQGREGWQLTCRLVSCCCWCAMVCFTSTLLMLCSMAYFLACERRW